MKASDIYKILETTLSPVFLEVLDDGARHKNHKEAKNHGGGHYQVHIVSLMFEGKTLIQRHQLVYQTLQMPRPEIHALSVRTQTPKEYIL